MNLFTLDDSDSHSDKDTNQKEHNIGIEPLLNQKRDYEQSQDVDSDSDSSVDWEDVEPLQDQEFFTVTIQPQQVNQTSLKRNIQSKRRKKRLAIHNISLVVYLSYGFQRNQWLNHHKLHRVLKQIFPSKIVKRNKKFWNSLNNNTERLDNRLDTEFIYILKYCIKWFVLNYRVNSNGIRVLGYLPEGKDIKNYFHTDLHKKCTMDFFIKMAKKMEGNRDEGAQIFTALLRMLGFDARLNFSLPLLPLKGPNQPELNKEKLRSNKDNDLLYPYFWTEVINPLNPSEIYIIENMCFFMPEKQFIKLKRYIDFEPLECYTNKYFPIVDQLNKMTMHYVVSYTNSNTVYECSPRYMPNVAYRYFKHLDLRTVLGRSALLFKSVIRLLNRGNTEGVDEIEMKTLEAISKANTNYPDTFSAMKKSPNFVTPSTLRYNESIEPNAKHLALIKLQGGRKERLYYKDNIVVSKSEQQWKILGRSIIETERSNPTKTTKERAKTLLKKRKLNLESQIHGIQELPLYSYVQTQKYPPMTIENNKLPRNQYGNIEIFKEWMKPDNCKWLKMSGVESILKRYQSRDNSIDFVPVVTGFDFRARPGFAVPITEGVIVKDCDEIAAKRIWHHGKIVDQKNIEEKRKDQCLYAWKYLLQALRINRRIDNYL